MQGVTSWLADYYVVIIIIVVLLAVLIVPSKWRRFQANRKARSALMTEQAASAAPQNGVKQQVPPVVKAKTKQSNNHVPAPSTPSLDELLKQAVAQEVQRQIKPVSDKVDGIVKSLQSFRDSLS